MPRRTMKNRSRRQRGGESESSSDSSDNSVFTNSDTMNIDDMNDSNITTGGRHRRRHKGKRMGGSMRSRSRNAILFGGNAPVTQHVVAASPTTATITQPAMVTTTMHNMVPKIPAAINPVTKGGRRSRQRGGNSEWIMRNFGDMNTQWNNVFGPSSTTQQGNLITTVPGAPAVVQGITPTGSLNSINQGQTGGRRRKTKKGGMWGQIIKTALVPFGLVGLQHSFAKRVKRNKTKKN